MRYGALLALVPFGLIVAMASPKDAQASGTTGNVNWKDADAPSRIRQYAAPIEAAAGWEGLGDFLVALAFTESRGNSQALGDGGNSGGWFQMKKGARCVDAMGLTATELSKSSEGLQVLLAACHAHRLGTAWQSSGQAVEWRDVRRGWAFPKWVKESYRQSSETKNNRTRFARGIRAAGLPASFANRRTFPSGFEWPGLSELLTMI
jgi:hypothetical protein